MAVGAGLKEAREAVANFPTHGNIHLLVEATNEIVAEGLKARVEIEHPSSTAISITEKLAKKGISNLPLIYLPGLEGADSYPAGFHDRLSSGSKRAIALSSLDVTSGWRFFDTHQRKDFEDIHYYLDDDNFLDPIIYEGRNSGKIRSPENLEGFVTPSSRLGLLPHEIGLYVASEAENLIGHPIGSVMRIPSLRESMMVGSLYEFVPVQTAEWQVAKLKGPIADEHYPAGLIESHSIHENIFYDIRTAPFRIPNPRIGFRLTRLAPRE